MEQILLVYVPTLPDLWTSDLKYQLLDLKCELSELKETQERLDTGSRLTAQVSVDVKPNIHLMPPSPAETSPLRRSLRQKR